MRHKTYCIPNKLCIILFTLIGTLFLYSCDMISGLNDEDSESEDDQELVEIRECRSSNASGTVDGEFGAKGQLSASCDFQADGLIVNSLTLGYEIDTFFGEPTRKAAFKWEGEGSISDVKWGAAVVDDEGRQFTSGGSPVYMSWVEGTFEGPGEGFGSDVTGSPSWDSTFLFYDENENEFLEGVPEETAIDIFQADFTLDDLMILEINDVAVTN